MENQQRGQCAPKRDSQKEPNVIGYTPSSDAVRESIRTLAGSFGRTEQEIVQWLIDTSPSNVPLVQQGCLGRALSGALEGVM